MLYFFFIFIGLLVSGFLLHLWWSTLPSRRQEASEFSNSTSRKVKKKKPKKVKFSLNIKPSSGQSCPLCRERIDSCVFYCDDCKTLYHVDCIDEMSSDGKCVTSGCVKKFNVKRANRV